MLEVWGAAEHVIRSGRLDSRLLITLLRTDACMPALAATQFGRSEAVATRGFFVDLN